MASFACLWCGERMEAESLCEVLPLSFCYLRFTIYYLIVWRLYIYYLAIYYLLFAVWLFAVLTVCYLVVYGLLSRGFGELDGLLPCLGGIPVRNFCRIFVNDMFFFME